MIGEVLVEGHNIIVRAARENANAKRAKIQIENARELTRAEIATAQLLTKMSAENVGSLQADVRSEQPTNRIYCNHTENRAQN